MKSIFIFILAIFSFQHSFAHRQHVHQYLTKQAYELLKLHSGDIPGMMERVGTYDDIGNVPWRMGYLTTGAWREDEEDNSINSTVDNSLFLELGGNGILITVNYERLIAQKIGIRIGYGGSYGVGSTMPFMLNYYLGNRDKFELGGGLVYLPTWTDKFPIGVRKSTLFAFTIGYKYQPMTGGVMGRIAFTPFYDSKENKGLIYGGISIGYVF